jgi:hypothetical protein
MNVSTHISFSFFFLSFMKMAMKMCLLENLCTATVICTKIVFHTVIIYRFHIYKEVFSFSMKFINNVDK